jgi:hypothetical protein
MTLERFAFLLLVVTFGWQNIFAQQTSAQRNVPQDTIITLRRLPDAFGNGANYGVKITADGALVIERFQGFNIASTIKGNISRQKVTQLIAEFERVNYFSLKDRYAESEDGCPVVGTDQPYAVVSFQINGRKKVIVHYYGCGNRYAIKDVFPPQLFDLEKKIDEIIGTDQWLKGILNQTPKDGDYRNTKDCKGK